MVRFFYSLFWMQSVRYQKSSFDEIARSQFLKFWRLLNILFALWFCCSLFNHTWTSHFVDRHFPFIILNNNLLVWLWRNIINLLNCIIKLRYNTFFNITYYLICSINSLKILKLWWTGCSEQTQYLKFKWQQPYLNCQSLSLKIQWEMPNHLAKLVICFNMIELGFENLPMWSYLAKWLSLHLQTKYYFLMHKFVRIERLPVFFTACLREAKVLLTE